MEIIYIIFSALLGVLIGSFLNVVVLRFNTGKSIGGRSGCFSCGHQLSWYELIPVFSWLIQGGKCRHCKVSISPLYIYGELTTSFVFGLLMARGLFWGIDILQPEYLIGTLFLFLLFSILLVIFWYDMRHFIIPDIFSFIFAILAFLSTFFFDITQGFVFTGWQIPSWTHLLSGILIPLPFVLLWVISKGRWIGLGDPKLMVGIAWLFGLTQGFSVIILSFWIGAGVMIMMMTFQYLAGKQLFDTKKKSIMKLEIPFAPFMIAAVFVTLLFNINIFSLL